jgi:hypothetical protein
LTNQLRENGLVARYLPEGPTIDEPEHPLRVSTTLPHPQAVWRDVTIEQFSELSLGKWETFARTARRSTTIAVCDGLLFHGNMADLFLMNAPVSMLERYVLGLLETIAELTPVVVYLDCPDVAMALRTICDERGNAWKAYQIAWKTGGPYSRQRSFQGFAGLVALYQNYRAVCNDILAKLDLPKISIRTDRDWAAREESILAFLQLACTRSPNRGDSHVGA